MADFRDLKFQSHPSIKGWAGHYTFKNGYRISIVAGESAYCTPKLSLNGPDNYSEFEVAILNPTGEFATTKFIKDCQDPIIGWQDRKAINELMAYVETSPKNPI